MARLDSRGSLRALIVMPVGEQRGGAEHQLQQLIEHRAEARIEPTVAFLQDGPMVTWCEQQGVRSLVLAAGRVRQALAFTRTVRALASVARQTSIEVVIGWMAKGQLYAGAAARAAGVPSVWLQPGTPSGLAAIDRAATLLPSNLVITVSRTTDIAQRRLRPRRRTAVIYPAVDTTRFDPDRIGEQRVVRRRLGLPLDGPIFGSVGRLNSWKGFHILLDAVPGVLERHPDATFVLVGGRHELEASYADRLQEQASRVDQNGRVLLVGQRPNPEEWIQAMDVFVHTSDREPFGMVIIEAMALGKPVIATAEGGPTEIITPGVDGMLCPFGDRRGLEALIHLFLSDRDLRRSTGLAATSRARAFGVHEFARRFGSAVADAVT